MRGHLCVALVCSILPLAACSHGPALRVAPPAPTHAVPAWSGQVRLSSGNGTRSYHDNRLAVASTLEAVMEGMGIDARVSCLGHDGDLMADGAIHASVRVEFLEELTHRDRMAALQLLEGLRPSPRAFVHQPHRTAHGVVVAEVP